MAPVECAPGDLAWLFYTSGTTGRPKGAMLTHRNIMAFVTSMLADGGGTVRDHVLHFAPLSHGSGFLGLCYLMRGRTNVVLPQGGLDRAAMTAVLDRFAPISFFAVPTVINALMAGIMPPDRVRDIHMIYFGGAPMYVDDLKRAIEFFGAERLWHLYGQGEAPMTITCFPPWLRGAPSERSYETGLASVGIARTGVAVCVLDDAGTSCPPGQIGEVGVRGDVVMAGYWNDDAATAAAFRNGWLLTGDLGAMDSAGFLTLYDRSKDMIISGGSNIYPREIEEVLLTYPGIRECAVVGIHDSKWGEVPVAFVVASGNPAAAALDAHCLAHLARFKRPRAYRLVAELPKNGIGKVVKTVLRRIAEAE
jgi:long-chain acyl-CoA synthetase